MAKATNKSLRRAWTKEDHKTMKAMLDNFYSERLWTPTEYDDKNSFGKLGWEYMKDKVTQELFDAGVVARTTGRGNYNYGLVIQGLTSAPFSSLARELDKLMQTFHP